MTPALKRASLLNLSSALVDEGALNRAAVEFQIATTAMRPSSTVHRGLNC